MTVSIVNDTSVSSTPLEFNLDTTIGATFIGYGFACIVFGALTIQVFNYYQKHAADSLSLKTLVVAIWSLELLQLALITHAVYHYVISMFGSVLDIFTKPIIWSLVTVFVIGTVSTTTIKG
jgi:hypothetical protein